MSSNGLEETDVVVVGAGVVGLAVARALAIAGREVLVIEAEAVIGSGTSSRNSEVIHAGIYHPRDSLKSKLCVAGRKALYRYCEERGIPHRRLGKLIVAAPGETEALRRLGARARENGVDDLIWLDARQAYELEPEVVCDAALLSPSTGIIDVHALMLSYQGDLEQHGGVIAFNSRVRGGGATGEGILLEVDAGGTFGLRCRTVVNCAGLGAQQVASSIAGMRNDAIPVLHLAKGNYFRLARKAPFRHLVYPLPAHGGAGVHVTLDLAGQARFGPDVEWVDRLDYRVDETRLPAFESAIREYWPSLPDGAILPDYAGIRPKLHATGSTTADFVIQDASAHGAPGLINLFGIESPGLTSSLAIADYVAKLVETDIRP
ncbi:NAD(P)/FAD-dependent oxidoreductase [Mesorhizobium sp. 1B3]|uniref:NAD(P)/FAD-dependent oxidoreductase n=1 Tax=Mesorhizobium sp. 1B3 TaxID=3243599 RepID=UPI003D98507C